MDQLVECGLLTQEEAAREDSKTVAASRVASLKGDAKKYKTSESDMEKLKTENGELKAKLGVIKAANAESEVKKAVEAGRIAAMEEDRDKYGSQYIIFPNPTDGHWIAAMFGESEPPASNENRTKLINAATIRSWDN